MRSNPTLRGRTIHTLVAALLLSIALPAIADDGCIAHAGTITTDFGPICLVGGSATIVAVPGGDAVVPDGFSTLFVLTRTNGLIIEQVNTAPSFTVSTVDVWRIHTLVYDPTTLDLTQVELGNTNAYELQDLLVQGGGSICASLGMSGAPLKTGICEAVCNADAGTISPDQPDLCLEDGEALLTATPDGNANVPVGYQTIFVLTIFPDVPLLSVSPVPFFTVTSEGPYTIHTLVYDPAALDIDTIVPGETTALELNALLQQGGGEICGSLDLAGAQFQVVECNPSCEAFAGSLSVDTPEVCLLNGNATLQASPNGDAVIPDDFLVAYFLAQGPDLIIQDVQALPSFTVTAAGNYAILSLIYAPFTIDPFEVEIGITSAFEVYTTLIPGGGPYCGSLGLVGAAVSAITCEVPCTNYAGADAAVSLCSNGAPVSLFALLDGADPGGSWTDPNNEPSPGIFNPTVNAPGTYAYIVPGIAPCPNDTAFVTVVVITAPDAGLDAMISICSNDDAVDLFPLLGSADPGGTWTNPAFSAHSGIYTPSTDAAGLYVYTAEGTPPCANATASVLVLEVQAPDAGQDTSITVFADGPPVMLFDQLPGTPQPGGTWTASGSAHSGVFIPGIDLSGVYIYTVAGTAPCLSDGAMVLVVVVPPPCTAGEDGQALVCFTDPPFLLITFLGDNVCPGGEWTSPAGALIDGIFDPATDPSGIYAYTVIGDSGEVDVALATIDVIECGGELTEDPGKEPANTGTPTSHAAFALHIWPNPATDAVRVDVHAALPSTTRVDLIDEQGRAVSVPVTFTTNALLLDVRALHPGVWTVRLTSCGGTNVGRFVHLER